MTVPTWIKVYPRVSLTRRLGWPVLTAVAAGQGVNLSWQPADSTTTGYEVSANGTITDVGLVTSHQVTGLPIGAPANFMVRPYNASGGRGAWSSVAVATPTGFNLATGGAVTDVPNYNGTGQTWRVHTFTANGTFSVASASEPFQVLTCGGGGGGGGSNNAQHGGAGGGGKAAVAQHGLTVGDHAITVGAGGRGGGGNESGQPGASSAVAGYMASDGGSGGGANAGGSTPGSGGANLTSTISGASVVYGANCPEYNAGGGTNPPTGPGAGGAPAPVGTNGGGAGQTGRVVVAYRIG